MAQIDYQLARDILNAFKVKSISPRSSGYVTKKYGWLPYDKLLFYARRFLPTELNHRFEKNEDYIKYVLEWQKSDPELSKYFNPETTPEESDNFHQNIAKDGREPTDEERKEDRENKERAEVVEAAGEEEVLGGGAAAAATTVSAEQYQSGAKGYSAGFEEYKKKQAEKPPVISPQPSAPPIPPIPAIPAKPAPISKNALKRSPNPKFAVLNGRIVALNPKSAGNKKQSFSKQEVEKMRRIAEENLRTGQAKQRAAQSSITKRQYNAGASGYETGFEVFRKQRMATEPPVVLSKPRRAFPRIRMPGFIKDAGNKLQISAKPVALFAVIGAAMGIPLGPVGVLAGAAAGFAASKFFPSNDSGEPAFFGGDSNSSQQEPNYSQPASQGRSNTPVNRVARQGGQIAKDAAKKIAKQLAKKVAAALAEAIAADPIAWLIGAVIVIVILIFFILMQGIPGSSLCFPGKPCGLGGGGGGVIATNPNPGNNNSGSLLACTFTAGATGQQQIKIGDPNLANFITDTANKVGIPASVLAGVLAIEHGSALSSTDPTFFANDYDATPSFTNQAFGFAQFEPATFDDYFMLHEDDINQLFGLNKTDDDTNPQDHSTDASLMRITSIRDSIILAAFKIKDDKDAAVGPSAAWDKTAVDAVAKAYQGGCDNNYCANLEASFQSCNTSTAVAGGPHATPPPTNLPLDQAIQQEFGITFKGFDDEHLQWARAKLWDISGTKLASIVKGTVIQSTGDITSFTSCSGKAGYITLHPYTPEAYFDFIMTHELGHVVQSCAGQGVGQHQQAVSSEGLISYYSQHAYACNGLGSPPGGNSINEDFADMVAYYLNPNAGMSSAPYNQYTCPAPQAPPPPYKDGGFPLHYSTVQSVLGAY